MRRLGLIALLVAGCQRPSDSYDVKLYGEGTYLDEIEPAPEPMGGAVEWARYRLWGSGLGLGITGLFGDLPLADGGEFTASYGELGYPADASYDRLSLFVSPGPSTDPSEDACLVRVGVTRSPLTAEYVDVGDRIAIEAEGVAAVLERDPAVYPRPAGSVFFVGYGGKLGPVVPPGHPQRAATWAPGQAATVRFPGTVQPPEATFGAILYPAEAALDFPAEVQGLQINGRPVRAPISDADGRHEGPWEAPTEIRWTPSGSEAVTLTVRYLSSGIEIPCDCATDCGDGFGCEEGWCTATEGSGWAPVGEVTCTVADDGAFDLTADHLARLDRVYDPRVPEDSGVEGVVLLVSTLSEGAIEPADTYTWNGKAVPAAPIRTRLIDTVVTRLETP